MVGQESALPQRLLIQELYGYNLNYANNRYCYPYQHDVFRSGKTIKLNEPKEFLIKKG